MAIAVAAPLWLLLLLLPLPPAAVVAAAPPNPVYTAVLSPLAEAPVAVADMVEEMVDVLTRFGSCAPHGFCVLQLLAHMLFCPQLVTHWLPYSVHSKYGTVCEYSEAFGDRPFSQTQL